MKLIKESQPSKPLHNSRSVPREGKLTYRKQLEAEIEERLKSKREFELLLLKRPSNSDIVHDTVEDKVISEIDRRVALSQRRKRLLQENQEKKYTQSVMPMFAVKPHSILETPFKVEIPE